MALPVPTTMADHTIPGGQLVDLSTASISYAPVTVLGVVINAYCCISAAITGANATVTVKVIKGGVTTTIGTITAAYSGSAAGSVFTASITGTEKARTVKPGDTIVFDSDGASSTTSIANFAAVVRSL